MMDEIIRRATTASTAGTLLSNCQLGAENDILRLENASLREEKEVRLRSYAAAATREERNELLDQCEELKTRLSNQEQASSIDMSGLIDEIGELNDKLEQVSQQRDKLYYKLYGGGEL